MNTTDIEPSELLDVYLNDHLMGACGGVELARRIARTFEEPGERGVLKELAAEIEEDRQSLMDAMDRLDVPKHSAKMAAGWLGEKIGRLKPNGSLLHRTALTPVVVIGRAPGVSDAVPRPSPADAPPRCPGR